MAGAVHFSFRDQWAELKRSRPGRRFQDRYEHAHREKNRSGNGQRLVLLVVALVAVAIGAVLAVFPGPAVPFFIVAGALLASESRPIARFMDWSEVRLRRLLAWAKRRWRRLSSVGRAAVLSVAAASSAVTLYLGYRLLAS